MPHPPRPHFLSPWFYYDSIYPSLSLLVPSLIVTGCFRFKNLFFPFLVSSLSSPPAVSPFMFALMFSFGIWPEHSSDSVTVAWLCGLNSSHIRTEFGAEYFISATTTLQRNPKESDIAASDRLNEEAACSQMTKSLLRKFSVTFRTCHPNQWYWDKH